MRVDAFGSRHHAPVVLHCARTHAGWLAILAGAPRGLRPMASSSFSYSVEEEEEEGEGSARERKVGQREMREACAPASERRGTNERRG